MKRVTPYSITFLSTVTRGYRAHLLGMAIITIIWSVDDSMLRPYAIKLFIDQMATVPPNTLSLTKYAAFYIMLRLIMTVLMRIWDWLSLHMVPGIKSKSLELLTTYAMQHPQGFMQRHLTGMLASSISTSAEGAPYLILPFVGRLLGSGCRILFAISALWAVTPYIAGGMSLWALLFLGGGMIWALRSHYLADITSKKHASATGAIVDMLSNLISVHLFGHYTYEAHRIQQFGTNWASAEQRRESALLYMHIVQGASFLLLEIWSLWMIISGYSEGILSVGDAALIISINTILIEALWDIPQEVAHVIRALGKLSQGLEIIMKPYELTTHRSAPPLHITQGKIEYRNVKFRYPGNPLLFNKLSITIEPGQKIGIVGYSGSGKSTFVNLIVRLFDIESGAIYIDDQDIAHVQLQTLRNAISYIAQDSLLFHRSIQENISYGNLEASTDEIIAAAKKAALHEYIMLLPQQYATIVGERGITLSVGQKQRILIARAHLKKAKIVIIDEGTSSLDYCTESYVQQSLQVLTENCTTLIIAHRFTTLKRVDRILVLDQGVIVQDGSYEFLLHQNGLFRTLCNAQTGSMLPESYCKQ